jgi:AcrR family transcriptional regulator
MPRRPPAPSRHSRKPAEIRRADILAVAAGCFSTRGFDGTTTRDIATRVGITEAALYRYFPSKEAIYTAILEERMHAPDPVAKLEGAAEAGDDVTVFGGLALALLDSIEADPTFLRLALFSALEGHQLARPFQEKRIRRLNDFLAGYIERRVRDGAFRELDAPLAARSFVGMVIDFLIVREVWGRRDEYPHTNREAAEHFVGIFLRGVRSDERRGRGRDRRRRGPRRFPRA